MTTEPRPANENRLLATLDDDERAQLAPHLEAVSLASSHVLFRPEERLQYVYFPVDSVVSLMTDLSDGSGMEVGLVGREGFVGISAILGGSETKVATVQAAGTALKIRAEKLREEFGRGAALQNALLRYTHALMTQISQSVVCNVRHQVDGRMARWLLMLHDRLETDEFELTHEFMSHMLGVRRSSISEVAYKLQERGFIHYERGHIRMLDRKGMEDFTCECYPVVKQKFDDFLL
jgi:CRP-like cAMP-binding protein